MNDEISEIRNSILVKQAAIENTKEQMTSIEDANYLDILEASKDKEFAKDNNLTNEKGRELALKDRLLNDPEYQRLATVYKAVKLEIDIMSINLEHERNKFKVWYVGQLQLIDDRL